VDTFALIVVVGLVVVVGGFFLVGWLYRFRPVAEFLDKRANERWAEQLKIEQSDIPQMVAASNEYRRRRGLPEVTEEEFRAKVGDEQRELLLQAGKQIRAERGRRRAGRNAARERRGF
jgi:hypothetical protein